MEILILQGNLQAKNRLRVVVAVVVGRSEVREMLVCWLIACKVSLYYLFWTTSRSGSSQCTHRKIQVL